MTIRDPGPPYAALRAAVEPCPGREWHPTREAAARRGPERRVHLCPLCRRFHVGSKDPVRLRPGGGPAMGGPTLGDGA